MGAINTDAYTVCWGNDDHSILVIKPKRTITWAEYREGTAQVHHLIRQKRHKVHIVFLLSGIEPLPPGNATAQFKQTLAEQPANCGLRVIVGASPITRTTVQVFLFAAGYFMERVVQFADNLDEAQMLIERSTGGRHANSGA